MGGFEHRVSKRSFFYLDSACCCAYRGGAAFRVPHAPRRIRAASNDTTTSTVWNVESAQQHILTERCTAPLAVANSRSPREVSAMPAQAGPDAVAGDHVAVRERRRVIAVVTGLLLGQA